MPRCPTCEKTSARTGNAFFPFCSERCKLVDLGRWMGEDYRIPAEETPSSEPPPAAEGEGKKVVH